MNFDYRLKNYKKKAFVFHQYKDFFDVPEKHRTPEGACSWMSTRLSSSFTPVIELFSQIPGELVSDDLRQMALMKDVGFIKHIDPADTEHYLDLYIAAYRKGGDSIQPHPDYQTALTVQRMMIYHTLFELSFFRQPWIANVMTLEQCEVASEQYIRIMARLPMEKISQKAPEMHLKHGHSGYSLLRREGKLKLAANYLKSGAWPTFDTAFDEDQPEPQDLQDAIKIMIWGGSEVCSDLYMAWVMAQPIEQVVPLMTSRVLIDMAIEMYSERELRPYLNTNRHLKAALLESALGL